MKSTFLTILFQVLTSLIIVQSQSNPKIAILEVGEINTEAKLVKELDKIMQRQEEFRKQEALRLSSEGLDTSESQQSVKDIPKNFKIIFDKLSNYRRNSNSYWDMIPLNAFNYITYALERMPKAYNYIVYPLHIKSTMNLEKLNEIATKEAVDYVIVFPSVKLYRKRKLKFAEIRVVLYNRSESRITFDKRITKSNEDVTGRFYCEDGTVDCAINSVLYDACWVQIPFFVVD